MVTYLLDWAALLVRWLHLIAGVAWIGASFYFVWLDNHLQPIGTHEGADPAVAGELWAVHGGGFYRSQKYRVAPVVLPPTLHWFYWEAYTTWLSGFGLLCLLYFFRAEAYLIDPNVLSLPKHTAVAIAVAVIVSNWLIYDFLCRSPLARRPALLAAGVAVLVIADAWALCHLFSGRGAFMIFGSALGTIMVANVLLVIIPGQRELVNAKTQGREPDAAPGLRGKQRSVHNTYLTLPVLFVMISNHYPITYGDAHNWLVLIAMSFGGACIRAGFVARHKPAKGGRFAAALPAVLAVATLSIVIIALSPVFSRERAVPSSGLGTRSAEVAADGAHVQRILEQRCAPCHSSSPTEPGFSSPPNGLKFEHDAEVVEHLDQVREQLTAHAMPLGNLTGMTEAERRAVLLWIAQGARP